MGTERRRHEYKKKRAGNVVPAQTGPVQQTATDKFKQTYPAGLLNNRLGKAALNPRRKNAQREILGEYESYYLWEGVDIAQRR